MQTTVLVALVLAAVFFVPYLITPPMTVSRSYVAGYSNRAAVLLLLLGMAVVGWFTGGMFASVDNRDSRLPWTALLTGMAVTLAACLSRCNGWALEIPGGECLYLLNRQQMLAAGRVPYRQFEFGYGPLLLYPGWWLQRVLHTTALHGYVLSWMLEALLGAAMIWGVVRGLKLAVPSRWLLFLTLLFSQVVWLDYGGTNYTPFRTFFAVGCLVLAHAVWRRTQSAWWMAVCSVCSVACSMLCSVDQAVGVAFGLNAFMLLLVCARSVRFPVGALALSMAGTLGCFAAASHWGMLLTMRSFGSGGYAYPVLPSPAIALVLLAYLVGVCFFCGELFAGCIDSVVVLLTLGGVAMLPAALGRCDVLHVEAATPLFVVGTAAICAMPQVRRWWLPLGFVFLIAIPMLIVRRDDILYSLAERYPKMEDWADRVSEALTPSGNQAYLSATQVPERDLPCDRTYYSPSLLLMPLEPFRLQCLDTGYYLGFTNVSTPATIEDKVEELRKHAGEPLLMELSSLEEQIPVQLATMDSLHVESESVWVPRAKHTPLTYAPVILYIKQHYVPGPTTAGGRLRIWMPRQTPVH